MSFFINHQGKGFPVVLIHGFCETHEVWSDISTTLSKKFRVLSIDLPGFGKSELLDTPFSIDDVGNYVFKQLRRLGIEKCSIIGHSLGGYVALAIAENHPEFVQSFGLFHSTAIADSPEKKLSRNKVVEFVEEHGVEPFIRPFIPPLFYDQKAPYVQGVVNLALTTPLDALTNYAKAMRDRPDRTELLKRFDRPILFVVGDKDGGISVESIEEQASMSKNSHLSRLSGVAHMGMYEAFEKSVSILTAFLEQSISALPDKE